MGTILFIVCMLVSAVVLPIGFICGFISNWYKKKFWYSFRNIDAKFRSMAVSFDMFGNVVCGELFNTALRTRMSAAVFGIPGETVSSVLGKNQRSGTLSRVGKMLVKILCFLEKDHCLKSIIE